MKNSEKNIKTLFVEQLRQCKPHFFHITKTLQTTGENVMRLMVFISLFLLFCSKVIFMQLLNFFSPEEITRKNNNETLTNCFNVFSRDWDLQLLTLQQMSPLVYTK